MSNLSRLQEFKQHRLYILVVGLDGPLLSLPSTQELLSRLASCRVVSLIACVDHVNSPLMWGHELLARFRWTYHHLSTFDCYRISNEFEAAYCTNKKARMRTEADMSNHAGLEHLLKSLTNKHREIVAHIGKLPGPLPQFLQIFEVLEYVNMTSLLLWKPKHL